jgi:hypothetical protein
MARLPAIGATICTPHRDKEELRGALSDLRVGHAFDNTAEHELYWKLGAIIGQWLSEQQRLEVSAVAKAFLSIAKDLSEVSRLLGGIEAGLHSDFEIAVAHRTAEYLALDPTVGSLAKAQELVSSFQQDAARIAHVCMVAYVDLPDSTGERGRRALDWYDDFTALLLNIASKGGVEPTLGKDRSNRARTGWLLEAALALERFFPAAMRSPSAEACAKRLERSRRNTKRQKSPAR